MGSQSADDTTCGNQTNRAKQGGLFKPAGPRKRLLGRFENVPSLRRFSQILDKPAGMTEAMKGFGGAQN